MSTAEIDLGHLACPEGGTCPGVVMIPDVWGLSDLYRTLAQRLAREGFAVLAVDLYRRLPEVKIGDPGRWIRGLADPEVLADVQAAVDRLADGPSRGHEVGVVGFCMGGQYTILAAAGCTGLGAAVAFYGLLSHEHGLLAPPPGERLDPARKPRSPLEAAARVACPLLGLFGREDPFIPVSDVHAFEAGLARSGRPHQVVIYDGAGHAFLNERRPEMYRPDAARDAWGRMLAWLGQHLA
jgi:carboxymethylenebutenolidase